MDDDPGTVIIGAGGHARVVADALGERLAGHLSTTEEFLASTNGLGPRLGSDADIPALLTLGHQIAIGVGFVDRVGALRRAELVESLSDFDLAVVRHPSATVSSTAILGSGAYVGAGAVVGVAATIGCATIVNSGAVVEHDCSIGCNVHIAPGAVLSGGVIVGDHTLIGVGASVIEGVSIGARSVIGAGSVVIDDIPANVTAVGVPARTIEQHNTASEI